VLVIGTAERFGCGKQIASYLGSVPSEESSGDRRRLGHISKPGNALLRFLLVEAAQVTVRSDPEWRGKFFHLAMRRGRKIAKVAVARRLAVRLYWMWRKGCDYEQLKKFGSHAARTSPWCAVDHRRNDWASRSPSRGVCSSNQSTLRPKRWMGRTEFPDLKRLRASLGLGMATLQRERNGALFGVHELVCSKSA
jgi:hypothetical protein